MSLQNYKAAWEKITEKDFYWAMSGINIRSLYLSREDAITFIKEYYRFSRGRRIGQNLVWYYSPFNLKIELMQKKNFSRYLGFDYIQHIPELNNSGFFGLFDGAILVPVVYSHSLNYWCRRCGFPVFTSECAVCSRD